MKPSTCPDCKADFSYVGPDGQTYSRLIACYDPDLDCTTHYQCPDCRKLIPRPGWEFAADQSELAELRKYKGKS